MLAASLTTPECEALPVLPGLGDPVSDRGGDIGVAVWIALRKAHQGAVTNLAGQWRDSGSPVPGYLADALDRLTSSGQLALAVADPQSCGARQVAVTDTGWARYVTLCQIHNSPDSGRPPDETAPGGRPDTTTPVDSASIAAGSDPQRGTLGAGQVVINPGAHRATPRPTGLPVIDSPETAGQALGELFLANADRGDDAANDHLVAELVRRIRAQQNSRDRGSGQQRPPGLRVPAPQFPTRTAARTRLSDPGSLAPPAGGEPDPGCATGESSVGPLRWARCPDGRLHLLHPADAVVAATGGQAEALCGRSLPAEGLTLTHGCAGALCMTCLAGTGPHEPEAHGPENQRPTTGDDLRTAARPIGDQPARG